jgi:hypothetical protein
VSFALRPCGLVLVHTPDTSQNPSITSLVNTVMRARGSSFEHPTSRALARALIEDREGLEHEHQAALRRLADAERLWRALSGGSALSEQFSSDYAGLFRNIRIKPEGREALYEAHLYPVFSGNRCRLNITGIPGDEEIARRHVAVFAEYVDG